MRKINSKAGFSLLEMLISLSLGAILMAAIYQISIQLNFGLSQDRKEVAAEIKELGELRNLIQLFNNAGVYDENKKPIHTESDNKKVIVMFNGSNECFGRAYKDSNDADDKDIKRIVIEKSDKNINSIYCLEKEEDRNLSDAKIIIKDAEIESISYYLVEGSTKLWIANPTTDQSGFINGIYFRYTKDGETYGLFSAFNTRN